MATLDARKSIALSEFLSFANQIVGIKKTETILPIAKLTAYVDSLLVGDDLILRTSLTSPVGYDKEMIKLLHNHTELGPSAPLSTTDVDGNMMQKLDLTKFMSKISNIDKNSLLWALYKSTYENLDESRSIMCPQRECKHQYKDLITMKDLIHDDTYTLWEESLPFDEFLHVISVPYENFTYEFATRIPSMQTNNQLLNIISTDVLQKNLDNTNSIFSKAQQMVLLTKGIRLSNHLGQTVETSDIREMLMTCQSKVPQIVSETFFESYSNKFDKYIPKYYKETVCPMCKHEFKINIDLEFEFFRRVLYGRREGDQTL